MIVLKVKPEAPADVLDELKLMALRFPGGHALMVVTEGRAVTFGRQWRFDASPPCMAALGEFGVAEVNPSCA